MRAACCIILALSVVGCARGTSTPPMPALPSAAAHSAGTAVYKTLYSFKSPSDGLHPTTALVDLDDTFYGTTTSGGYTGGPCDRCGTVYSITSNGTEAVVYKFPGPPGGRGPEGNLIAAGGALYGTTFYGGAARAPRRCMPVEKGCGVVFSVDRSGNASVLHAFRGGDDGENPAGGLVRGSFPARSGYYGTTATSGLQGIFGTVFIVTADAEETLHRFAGPPNDGEFPVGSPAIIKDKLYGETAAGGAHNLGAIFEVTIKRGEPATERLLWSFSGQDGSDPAGGLTEINGALYGVASTGGPHNFGVLFAVTPDKSYHIIHAFRGRLHGDGADPQSPPIFVHGTTLYGTTYRGGTNGRGTVYAIDQHGNETVLHSFGPAPDGIHPRASLLWSNGTLYGTTTEGGAGDAVGTVFALTPP